MIRIKLIIFCLLVVVDLQCSDNQQEKTFKSAIYSLQQGPQGWSPVMLHKKLTYFDIKDALENSDVKDFLFNDANNISECILISDSDTYEKRSVHSIKLGKAIGTENDLIFTGSGSYMLNQFTGVDCGEKGFKRDEISIDIGRKIVIFNIYRDHDTDDMSLRYAREIKRAIVAERPLIVVVGSECHRANIENLLRENNRCPIILKEEVVDKVIWWRKYGKELVFGLSCAVLISAFYYLKCIR